MQMNIKRNLPDELVYTNLEVTVLFSLVLSLLPDAIQQTNHLLHLIHIPALIYG